MMIYGTKEELAQACEFIAQTKADEKRLESTFSLYALRVSKGDSGAFGKAYEVLACRPTARKNDVASQNKVDDWAIIDGKRVGLEVKTNGGRINDIKRKYVVYYLRMSNSTGTKVLSPRIIPTEKFLNALNECGAIKTIAHNGVVDGMAIQPSNRKFWKWLETQVIYERELEYFSEDFE